jgi:hypothetical protein
MERTAMRQMLDHLYELSDDLDTTYSKEANSYKAKIQEISSLITKARELLALEEEQFKKMYYRGFSEFSSEENYPNEFNFHFNDMFKK